jgi:aminopeptidase N
MKFLYLSVIVLCLVLAGCERTQETATTPAGNEQSGRQPEDALTHELARARKSRVANVQYELFFDLTSSDEAFTGQSVVRFDLSSADAPLTLDFSGAEIARMLANGSEIKTDYNGYFIHLPAKVLKTGSNEVLVEYSHRYDKDGTGLHRFTDTEDGRTYLYTYLWPYYANRLFPSFDQPNLKATFDLKVNAPKDWTVVSTATGQVSSSEDTVQTWTFETTPKMSTYIFSLHAGPFRIWEEMAGEVPIRLFARQSLAEFVAAEEWLELTRGGLDFFARYFDIPYPFGKYDQLIVPDFNIGAMENIAAVTFNERYVQRKPSDRFERESRAGVILHEMAHMWFGNLVTKDWWNGLWLNESFATLMANIALVQTTEFTDSWHRFFTSNKQSAYRKDSRVTTHPIEGPVNSTADFFSVFDAITYQKGSSVLKQLAYLVGEDNHRIGVSNYLKEHAYGNTTLKDFIDAQSKSSGRDLNPWSQQWLYQSGFNELQAHFTCTDGRITELSIHQSAPQNHPQLRLHRIQLALYEFDQQKLRLGQVLDVEIEGESTIVTEAVSQPCPALVFPNYDDWGFARVVLDDAAITAITGRIRQLDDPLARSMFIRSLFDMSQAGDMPIQDYVNLALDESEIEPNIRVLAQLTRSIANSVTLMNRLRPESEQALSEMIATLEGKVWQHATTETDPDRARLWFDLLGTVTASSEGQNRLRSLLDETATLPGVQLSPDLRWRIIITLSGLGAQDSPTLIAAERERDASDQGQKLAIAAEAARPDSENKSRWLAELVNPDSDLGLARQRFAIGALFPSNQTGLQHQHLATILESLPGLSDRDPYFMSSYVSGLLTPVCTTESVAAMAAALETGDLSSTAELFLREAHQADSECLALRKAL